MCKISDVFDRMEAKIREISARRGYELFVTLDNDETWEHVLTKEVEGRHPGAKVVNFHDAEAFKGFMRINGACQAFVNLNMAGFGSIAAIADIVSRAKDVKLVFTSASDPDEHTAKYLERNGLAFLRKDELCKRA